MKLAAMQFKSFVWPHNPRRYRIVYQRTLVQKKLPFGRYHLQNLGLQGRVLRGEGEFVGPTAYQDFKALAGVFYEETAGVLIHPVWQGVRAYFTELSLQQEPRVDYVRYEFAFLECAEDEGAAPLLRVTPESGGASSSAGVGGGSGGNGRTHTVRAGESLWAIAQQYRTSVSLLLDCNPQIKNPNRISIGEVVRLP